MSRPTEIGERVTVKALPRAVEASEARPARINAPTPRNVAVFAVSLLPWPTAVAVAVALLTQRLDPRMWLAFVLVWSAVEAAIRNPHQVTLERRADPVSGRAAYSLDVRSWWLLLFRSQGKTVALGPDSRLVRNVGVIDCVTGKLVELRIYRWQFSALVRAFQTAGFEVHDECNHAPSRWQARAPFVLFSVVAAAAVAMAVAAVALVEMHGL